MVEQNNVKKSIKVEVPEGYQIDKEHSTFENIVLKKVDAVSITWNNDFKSVNVIADGERFTIRAVNPSCVCNWNDAMRYFKNSFWQLPTIKQLKVIQKYIKEINDIIVENNGYEIFGVFWSCEEKSEFCAGLVGMNRGNTYNGDKSDSYYVRAVSTF